MSMKFVSFINIIIQMNKTIVLFKTADSVICSAYKF